MTEKEEATYALANAEAGIDGNGPEFRKGKGKPPEVFGCHYEGYMSEAQAVMKKLAKQGFVIVREDKVHALLKRTLTLIGALSALVGAVEGSYLGKVRPDCPQLARAAKVLDELEDEDKADE